MRDKQFVINSIKMDLHRVVTGAGDINKELPRESVEAFLDHALTDFEKIELNKKENQLKKELEEKRDILLKSQNEIADPHLRLRWTEDVLTIRNRL